MVYDLCVDNCITVDVCIMFVWMIVGNMDSYNMYCKSFLNYTIIIHINTNTDKL